MNERHIDFSSNGPYKNTILHDLSQKACRFNAKQKAFQSGYKTNVGKSLMDLEGNSMSTNNTSTAQTIKEEIETSGKLEGIKEFASEHAHNLYERRRELEFVILDALKKDPNLQDLDAKSTQALVDNLVHDILDEVRRDEVAQNVADRINFSPANSSWLAGKLVDFVSGTGAVLLGMYVGSRVLPGQLAGLTTSHALPGGGDTGSSPFSDPTAASPRPTARRRESNVIPFDRQAS